MLNGASSLVSLLAERLQCKFPNMKDVISTAGVTKLLSDLDVSKAAGPAKFPGTGSFRPLVVSPVGRFDRGSFPPGSFRPGSFRM